MTTNSKIINPKNWVITDIFISNDKSLIYNVLPLITETTSEEDKLSYKDKKWILKVTEDVNEIDQIYNLKMYNNNLCIKIDKNSLFVNEKTKENYYAMEKYDDNIQNNFRYAQENFMKLGKYVIDFFHWLHVEEEQIHGDIKANNIVFKASYNDNPFKIIDYENIKSPDVKYICNETHNDNYYYYYLGCEYNKPYHSYRMDLQAFGYVLYSIAASDSYYYMFEWQLKACKYYQMKEIFNSFAYLDNIKKKYSPNHRLENSKYKDIINKYFDIIKNQEWNQDPNIDVYNKLKELFKDVGCSV